MSEITNKQAFDLVKRLSGNTIGEFADLVAKIEKLAGIGSTYGKIFLKHLKSHRPYFQHAYDQGRKDMASLAMRVIRNEQIGQGFSAEDRDTYKQKFEHLQKLFEQACEVVEFYGDKENWVWDDLGLFEFGDNNTWVEPGKAAYEFLNSDEVKEVRKE